MLRNISFFVLGIGFLALAKIKNMMHGYSTPKPFDVSHSAKCIDYDMQVVEQWISYLQEYTGNDYSLAGKNVLELGPGSDLGVGLCLLSRGCERYNACDVNDLMKSTPDSFYEELFERLATSAGESVVMTLNAHLKAAKQGSTSHINYVVRGDFDLVSAFGESTVDLVFSQAAFEHFDDIDATFSQLSTVCAPGAVLVTEIDLATHSRWICDKDPNNIYRYPNSVYNALRFRGSPNRVRPLEYRKSLERFGWTDIRIWPITEVNERNSGHIGMHKNFRGIENQMDILSIMLSARKPD